MLILTLLTGSCSREGRVDTVSSSIGLFPLKIMAVDYHYPLPLAFLLSPNDMEKSIACVQVVKNATALKQDYGSLVKTSLVLWQANIIFNHS